MFLSTHSDFAINCAQLTAEDTEEALALEVSFRVEGEKFMEERRETNFLPPFSSTLNWLCATQYTFLLTQQLETQRQTFSQQLTEIEERCKQKVSRS